MDSIANAHGTNIVNTALMLGHNVVRTEEVYTHATVEGLKSIVTPSKAILEEYSENCTNDATTQEKSLESPYMKPQRVNAEQESMSDKDKELYDMYLKLKEKFG